jgi:hypothetical protein
MTAYTIPELEPHCGSWIITDRATGKAVLETVSRRTAEAVNQSRYRVQTALQYLADLSRAGQHLTPESPAMTRKAALAAIKACGAQGNATNMIRIWQANRISIAAAYAAYHEGEIEARFAARDAAKTANA